MKNIGPFCLVLLLVLSFNYHNKYPIPYNFTSPKQKIPELNKDAAYLGRHLFYDPILSVDSTVSCASCHAQNHAFADSKVKSTGVNNQLTDRNSMPLFNLVWYESYFWDGRANTLEEQVAHPIHDKGEMNNNWSDLIENLKQIEWYKDLFLKAYNTTLIDSTLIVDALVQFELTLISANSKYDSALQRKVLFTPNEYQGFVIANDQSMGDCFHCHTTDANAVGTKGTFSNNGLPMNSSIDLGKGRFSGDPKDSAQFKIPSLRNLKFTAPYMHDGRFKTLEEVIDFYSEGVELNNYTDSKMQYAHRGGVKLTDLQKQQLLAFLGTLNDYQFVQDTNFSNPF